MATTENTMADITAWTNEYFSLLNESFLLPPSYFFSLPPRRIKKMTEEEKIRGEPVDEGASRRILWCVFFNRFCGA